MRKPLIILGIIFSLFMLSIYPQNASAVSVLNLSSYNLTDCPATVTKYSTDTQYAEFQVKYNLSRIPAGSTIINATYNVYWFTKVGTVDTDVQTERIDNQTWSESNFPAYTCDGYPNMTVTDTTTGNWTSTSINTWGRLDVTAQVSKDLGINSFTSIRFQDPDFLDNACTGSSVYPINVEFGDTSGSNVIQGEDRANNGGTGNYHYLQIFYNIPIKITYPLNATYPDNAQILNWSRDLKPDRVWYNFNGASNTTVTTWQRDDSIISGISTGNNQNKFSVFNMSGTFYMIQGNGDGTLTGYNWTGTTWQSDSAIVSGITTQASYTGGTAFQKNGTWYFINGWNVGGIAGYNWTGTTWQSDSGILSGFPAFSSFVYPLVFNFTETEWFALVCTIGTPRCKGYNWNWSSNGWQNDSAINSGLTGVSTYYKCSYFKLGGEDYLYCGNSSYEPNFHIWNGTQWVADTNLIKNANMIPSPDGVEKYGIEVFKMGDTFYSIMVGVPNPTIGGDYFIYGYNLTSLSNISITASNGQNNVSIWAKSSSGNTETQITYFTIGNVSAPILITMDSPLNQTYTTNNIWANATMSKNVTYCGYSLNGSGYTTMSNDSGSHWYSNLSLSNGLYSINFMCNDSESQSNTTATIYFTVNVPNPLQITSPTNTTYINPVLYLNWTKDLKADKVWYNLNGAGNTSLMKWQTDNRTKTGLSNPSSRSRLSVFDMSGIWYLIKGDGDTGTFSGYNWTGTTWQSDSAIVSGLNAVTGHAGGNAFQKNGTWYYITGDDSGGLWGYNWTGTAWQTDNAIKSGLAVTGYSDPFAFNFSSTDWVAIVCGSAGTSPKCKGYQWNWTTNAWVNNNTYTAGMDYDQTFMSCSPFYLAGEWNLICGRYTNTLYGYKWNGTTWKTDPTLSNYAVSFPTLQYYSPEVFNWNGTLYNLVFGSSLMFDFNLTNITSKSVTGAIGYNNVTVWVQNSTGDVESQTVYFTILNDTTPPSFSNEAYNWTVAGEPVDFSFYVTDSGGISYYKISFDNGTGTFVNDTEVYVGGVGQYASKWVNFTKTVNYSIGSPIRVRVYANDTSNNWNYSELAFSTTNIYNISQCVSPIFKSGFEYRLTADISCSFVISNVNNVTLDCMNHLVTASGQNGIHLNSTQYSKVRNCTVTGGVRGIRLENSDWNTVENFTGYDSTTCSVCLWSNSNNNTLTDIEIYGTDNTNFYIDGSNDNIITRYYGHDSSILMELISGSTRNIVKDSIFRNETQQMFYNPSAGNYLFNNIINYSQATLLSHSISEYWNTTKQSGTRIYGNGTQIGGNYWTTINGGGYSDNCTDSNHDGFCDIPFNLSIGGYDRDDNYDYLALSNDYSSNQAPEVKYVQAIANVNPTEGSTSLFAINFNATDVNGVSDINFSAVQMKITGLTNPSVTRTNTSCYNYMNTTDTASFTCSFTLDYYDNPQNYGINASAYDTIGASGYNDSISFTYNELKAWTMSPSSITYGSLNCGIGAPQGATDDPMVLNNTGNANITNVTVKAYDLIGQSDGSWTINSSYFTVNTVDSSGGDVMLNDTYVQIASSKIPFGQGSTESLFYWIEALPCPLKGQSYQSTWEISGA